jgi:hypothetical protein
MQRGSLSNEVSTGSGSDRVVDKVSAQVHGATRSLLLPVLTSST